MKFIILFLSFITFSSYAQNYHSIKVSKQTSSMKKIFWADELYALAFTSSTFTGQLVIECNPTYGIIGFSEGNYAGYNRISIPVRLSPEECEINRESMLAGKTLSFSWLKKPINSHNCGGYIACNYAPKYSID